MGVVSHIFVAPQRGAAMEAREQVEALTETGLSGDRYAEAANRRSPDYQITLIESENIEAFAAANGIALSPDMPRRNIVTLGVALNALCGRRFRIGDAVLEGLELCEPCSLFAKRTHRAVLKFFVGKGGLRARIVSGGAIRVGDVISDA